ncbi:MAG: IS3 family transposase [Oscillospiraceae bacterium]|nr:IS3 family transposase [Oscillospiraceae bacterium]
MAKRYEESFKEEIVKQYQSGNSAVELCAKFGIARSTLFLWLKQRRPDSNGGIPLEKYKIQKELERLRIENHIFRESGCSPNSPLAVRIAAIKRLKDTYSIHALCRVLQVNRSTFYHHEFRAPKKTQLELQDDILRSLIKEIFEHSCQRFGCRRIRAKLRESGYIVSERRISRLMKEMNLSAQGPIPKLNSANDRQYQYYPNKLKRNFQSAAPDAIWVSDITYARVGHDFMYLCVVIDLYSRKVVSYGISEYIDSALVTQTFLNAFETRGKPAALIFHSDQGTQYTSFEFCRLLKKLGVTQSFSAPGSPHDNAVAESFFASIKKEDFRRNFYKTEDEFCEAVKQYIEFYNDYRPHQRLGFLTPNQAEKEFYDAIIK